MITSKNIDELHNKILANFKTGVDLTPLAPSLELTIQRLIDDKFNGNNNWKPLIVRVGQTLNDTGQLASSVFVRLKKQGEKWIATLSEKFYGEFHEYGAKIRITPKSKKFFWYKYYSTKNPIWRNMAMTKKKYFTLPVRSHLRLSKADLKEIGLTIKELLKK